MSVDPAAAPSPAFAPRFDAPVRYGISLAAVILGAYLLIDNSYGQFVSVTILQHGDAIAAFYLFTQFLFGLIVVITGLLIAPTTIVRRIVAAAIVLAAAAFYAGLTPLYYTGTLPGGPLSIFPFILSAPFLFTAAITAGWLIVRERRELSYLFLLATILITVIVHALVMNNATSTISLIAANILSLIIGVGIAWAGRAVSGAPKTAGA